MLQWLFYPVIVIVITAIGAAWRLSGTITRIDTNVTEIKTNHLPHIEMRLDRLENKHHGSR